MTMAKPTKFLSEVSKPQLGVGLGIASNEISNARGISQFGFIPTIGSTYETVWNEGGTYAYPSTAVAMTATSSEAGTDENVEVTIYGLDENWAEVQQTLTLNASGTATSTQTFLRINSARISNGQDAVGNIEITNGATTYAYINSQFGKSLSSVYSVPAGYKAYIVSGAISLAKQKEVIAKFMVRQFGGIFIAEGIIGSSGAPFQKDWIVPVVVNEKSDIEVRAKAGATTEISTVFEIVLVDYS